VNLDGQTTPDTMRQAFHDRHRELFTYALEGDEVVMVNARVAALGRLDGDAGRYAAPPMPPATARRIRLHGIWREVPVHRFGALADGMRIHGPAILESHTTTILLAKGDSAEMDARGWLIAEVPG
jgi:N-methylhydantoinase A